MLLVRSRVVEVATAVKQLSVCGFKFLESASFATSLSEDDEKGSFPTTPWVRQVISGVALMRHPKYNKGLAFSESERDRLYLRGLLPSACLSQEVQLERTVLNIRSKDSDLEKYLYLCSLQERNENLFFRVLIENLEELLPIISTPTVELACQKYGLMFKSLPRGMYLSMEDRGRVFRILKNWPERTVKLVVVSDGERVGNVGDLGVQSIGVPISKLALYTACGGLNPSLCLPVCLDFGTDNEELLRSQFYVGARHGRIRGDAYFDLVDEFMNAIKRRFGNTTLIHFEDMTYENTSKILNTYRGEMPCFSGEISGSAAVVLAGILAALPKTGIKLSEHRVLISGEGPMGACIAELIATSIANSTGITILDARRHIWLVDQYGLVTRERGDAATLDAYKLPYCHSGPRRPDLLSSVEEVKPSILIGVSPGSSAPFKFDKQVLYTMAARVKAPLVFPLTAPGPECTPEEAYKWTQGQCLVATAEKTADFSFFGRIISPSQASSVYILPGVGLGSLASQPTKLRDDQFIAAAEALARMVTEEDLSRGMLFPSLSNILEISANVAKAVAAKAYDTNVATALPRPHNLIDRCKLLMYNPRYRRYR